MKCSRAAENSKQFLCAMACIQKADHKSSYWINAVLILPKECGHGHAPFRWSGGKSMRQTDLVESRFEASSFGRTAHDAGIDGSWHRKISEARGDEVFAVERVKNFEGRVFSNDAPPQRFSRGDAANGGPIGEFACKDDAGVTDTIDEFEAALQPVAAVDPHHQPCLIVRRTVFSGDTAF